MCGITFSDGEDNMSFGNTKLATGIHDPHYQVTHASKLEGINPSILLSTTMCSI